jgi:hypothetical protein
VEVSRNDWNAESVSGQRILLTTNLDEVESLGVDKLVFGLRVVLIAGAEVMIDKCAEDDLGGLYAHFCSERHESRVSMGVAAG